MTDQNTGSSGFGNHIRQRRLELGKSQSEVARHLTTRTGKPARSTHISRWELETKPGFLPDAEALQALSEALDTDVQTLVMAAGIAPATQAGQSLGLLSRWQVEVAGLELHPEVQDLVSDALARARRLERALRDRADGAGE